jgi:glycosyltransferase involved in cell wall biosynthesis
MTGDAETIHAHPRVSVVIPNFNCLSYLPGAISSIGIDFVGEIIIVDDMSDDGSRDYLVAAAQSDSRIVYLPNTSRLGVSGSRNRAITRAKFPITAFLDADDEWRPGKLKAQVALHQMNPAIGMTFTDYNHISMDGREICTAFSFWPRFSEWLEAQPGRLLTVDHALARIFAENPVGTSTVTVRTDLLLKSGGFSEAYSNAEDWPLWLTLARMAPVGCVREDLMKYRMGRPGSLTNLKGEARIAGMMDVFRDFRDFAAADERWSVGCAKARISAAVAETIQPTSPWAATCHMARAFFEGGSRRHGRQTLAMGLSALKSTGNSLGSRPR